MRALLCLVWRGNEKNPDPDTPPRASPDSGLNAWDERGTAVVRATAWPGHVAGAEDTGAQVSTAAHNAHQHTNSRILHKNILGVVFSKCTSANVEGEGAREVRVQPRICATLIARTQEGGRSRRR